MSNSQRFSGCWRRADSRPAMAGAACPRRSQAPDQQLGGGDLGRTGLHLDQAEGALDHRVPALGRLIPGGQQAQALGVLGVPVAPVGQHRPGRALVVEAGHQLEQAQHRPALARGVAPLGGVCAPALQAPRAAPAAGCRRPPRTPPPGRSPPPRTRPARSRSSARVCSIPTRWAFAPGASSASAVDSSATAASRSPTASSEATRSVSSALSSGAKRRAWRSSSVASRGARQAVAIDVGGLLQQRRLLAVVPAGDPPRPIISDARRSQAWRIR